MNDSSNGNDPKLHLGMTRPKAPDGPKLGPGPNLRVTSMNQIRKGNDPEIALGNDWAQGRPSALPK
eukprot:677357-Karenia_brevis.AAC.1